MDFVTHDYALYVDSDLVFERQYRLKDGEFIRVRTWPLGRSRRAFTGLPLLAQCVGSNWIGGAPTNPMIFHRYELTLRALGFGWVDS